MEFPHAISTIVVLDLTYVRLMNELLCPDAKQNRFLTEQIHTAISCACTVTEGLTVRNHNRGRREGRERTSYIHTDGDVASAEELTIDAELQEGGPAGVLLAPLSERLIGEHIERLEGHIKRPQNLHHRVGEAALREANRTH